MATPETLRDRFGAPFTSLPLSGQNTETEQAASTPGNRAGSFLLDKNSIDSSVRAIPTDDVSGLPYPVLPVYLRPKKHLDCEENYHHHFYHSNDLDLEGGARRYGYLRKKAEEIPLEYISGLAVRMSRGQMLAVGTHDELHKRFSRGPELPRTQSDKFRTVVLACAGVVSTHALDFTKPNGEELVRMDAEQLAIMTRLDAVLIEKQHKSYEGRKRQAVIGSFFLRYATEKKLDYITESVVDEFLGTTDPNRRRELGRHILREAIHRSTEPMLPQYAELRRLGVVPLERRDPRAMVQEFISVRSTRRVVKELVTSLDKLVSVAA